MAIFQSCEPEDELTQTVLKETLTKKKRSWRQVPSSLIVQSHLRNQQAQSTRHPVLSEMCYQLQTNYHKFLCGSWTLNGYEPGEAEEALVDDEIGQGDGEETVTERYIRTWSAYISLIASELLPITRVSTPPLIAAPAHEWNTLLAVIKQASAQK